MNTDKFETDIDAMKKVLEKKLKDYLINTIIPAFMNENPDILYLGVSAFTPSWNDGEECVHGLGGIIGTANGFLTINGYCEKFFNPASGLLEYALDEDGDESYSTEDVIRTLSILYSGCPNNEVPHNKDLSNKVEVLDELLQSCLDTDYHVIVYRSSDKTLWIDIAPYTNHY